MKKRLPAFTISELAPPIILAVLLVIAYCLVPGFDRPQIYLTILKNTACNGILALGLLFVLICGDIDFSIGAQMSFFGVILGLALKSGWVPVLAVAAMLLLAVLLGCIQGLLVGRYRLNSMIVSIATGVMLSGLTYSLANGLPVFDLPGLPLPSAVSWLRLPWPAVVLGLVAVLTALVLHQTYWGRFFYALGCDATAAERAGVPVKRAKLAAFALCSLCCGVCAATYVGQLGFSPLEAGQEATTSVLTIAALGGISFSGGRGKVLPILCAALLLSAMTSLFIVLRVPTYYQNCIKGGVIFVAIGTKIWKK